MTTITLDLRGIEGATVPAHFAGPDIAYHRPYCYTPGGRGFKAWHISHVHSGKMIASRRTRAEAKDLAEKLQALGVDWRDVENISAETRVAIIAAIKLSEPARKYPGVRSGVR